jgi:ribose transport system ATP-binding protein
LQEDIILEVEGIDKVFPGTKALNKVNFKLRRGEIHAVAGENGAGKSTLMNIIDGIYQPTAGEIRINGQKVVIKNPLHAHELGIGFVHQELAVCPHVTVAENVYMSAINTSKKWFVDYKELYRKTSEVLKPLKQMKPDAYVKDLGISSQQLIEIAKSLTLDCKILILDEPTASITEQETEALFNIMQDLKNKGISIIYISHRMAEIFSQCDRVTILRDGTYTGTWDVKEATPEGIVNKMVGRTLEDLYPQKTQEPLENPEIMLEVNNFSDNNRFSDINFGLIKGEILGISGLIGSGRTELAETICGLREKTSGDITFKGTKIEIKNYRDCINKGIVYLSEDRKRNGLFLKLSVAKNISALDVDQISTKRGLLNVNKEKEQANNSVKQLRIKCPSVNTPASSLSGGNQQKVVIGKMLTVNPQIIIMDEPTRGVDVGAKTEIYALLRKLTEQGIGVIVISSELPEIIGLCDRVLVMHEGKQNGIVSGKDLTEEKIIHLASGI